MKRFLFIPLILFLACEDQGENKQPSCADIEGGETGFCMTYPLDGQIFMSNYGCSKEITLEFDAPNDDDYCLAYSGAGAEFGILDCTIPFEYNWIIRLGENVLINQYDDEVSWSRDGEGPSNYAGFLLIDDEDNHILIGNEKVTVYLEKETDIESSPFAIYAEQHWSLYNWITATAQLQNILYDSLQSMGYNWDPDVHIIGTHNLHVVYDNQIFSSHCLYDIPWTEEGSETDCILPNTPEEMDENLYNALYIPALIESGFITVIKNCDSHFYENIGKYDQFVAGWDDILSDFIIQFNDVGDTTEIIITSPIKEEYLNLYNSALEGDL